MICCYTIYVSVRIAWLLVGVEMVSCLPWTAGTVRTRTSVWTALVVTGVCVLTKSRGFGTGVSVLPGSWARTVTSRQRDRPSSLELGPWPPSWAACYSYSVSIIVFVAHVRPNLIALTNPYIER